jgi:AcrR family transcriptional regulator
VPGNVTVSRIRPPRLGLSRPQIERLQRAHVAQVLGALVIERGYGAVAVADVIKHAAVSRRTFYRLFASKDEALVAAGELRLERAMSRMQAACLREARPGAQVRAALTELLELVAERPAAARLCLVECPAAGVDPAWPGRQLVPWVDRACAELGLEPALPAVATSELVAAIVGVLQARVVAGSGRVSELLPALLALGVRPARAASGSLRSASGARRKVRLGAPEHEVDRVVEALRAGGTGERRAALGRLGDLGVDAVIRQDRATLQALQRATGALAGEDGLAQRQQAQVEAVGDVVTAGLAGGTALVLGVAGVGGARRGGVSYQAFRCLRHVAEHPGATGQDVQAALGYRHLSQASRLLADLADRGLVRSRATTAGSRGWRVTETGRAELAAGSWP